MSKPEIPDCGTAYSRRGVEVGAAGGDRKEDTPRVVGGHAAIDHSVNSAEVSIRLPNDSFSLPNVSVHLANVSVPHVDDSECPVFFSVCPTFGHGPAVDVSVPGVDDSVPHPNVVDHPCRYVHEADGDDNDADGYVHLRYRDVNVRYRHVNERYRDVFGTHGDVHERYRDVQLMDGDVDEAEGLAEEGDGSSSVKDLQPEQWRWERVLCVKHIGKKNNSPIVAICPNAQPLRHGHCLTFNHRGILQVAFAAHQ